MQKFFSEGEKKSVLRNVILITPLTGAGIDIYVPSIPSIVSYFGTTASLVQLTVSAYLFGYGFFQIFIGILADIYGRRNILIFGLLLFSLASYLLTLAPSIHVLLLCRVIQGGCIASVGTLNKALLSDTYSGVELAKSVNWMTIAWALGPIIAPALGGYLGQHFNWKFSFYFLAFYSCVVAMSIIFTLPETLSEKQPFNLMKIKNNFKLMLTHRIFVGSIFCLGILYGLIAVFNVIAPFLVIKELGYSPKFFGWIGLLMGFAWFSGNLLNRYFIGKIPRENVIKKSLTVFVTFSMLMIVLALTCKLNLFIVIAPVMFMFFMGGILFPNFMGVALNLFTHIGGMAGATLGFLFIICTASFSAVASLFPVQTVFPLAVICVFIGFILAILTKFILRIS